MKSTKAFEDSALNSLRAYYAARRTAMQHPSSSGLRQAAVRKRHAALLRLRLLKAIEVERGVRL